MIPIIVLVLINITYFALEISGFGFFPKPLSPQEEKNALEAMKAGDMDARNKLIEHNLRLIAHIIKKYRSDSFEQEDLISIGTIGLIKAVQTFDVDKGVTLSTYAARCIENEILMYFRSIKKNGAEMYMDDPIDTDKDGNTIRLLDIIYSEEDTIEDVAQKIESEKLIGFVQNELSEREQKIIILRYGLNNRKPLTQREVASAINISRSYVSRIEKRALIKLRRLFETT